jgi:hypothetical protein
MNLYRDDFNVISNHGCLNRGLRSIVGPIVVILIVRAFPIPEKFSVIVLIVLLLLSIYIADKYVRRLYPDWPKSRNFIGSILFTKENITIKRNNGQLQLQTSDISEFIIFWDHYRGFKISNHDDERNGNALIYLKCNDGKVSVFKFNVASKREFEDLKLNFDLYQNSIMHCKSYKPESIPIILTPDLNSRRNYN